MIPFQFVILQGSEQERQLIRFTAEIAQLLKQEVIFLCSQFVSLINHSVIIR